MKKITVVLIRKVFPRADDKSVVFVWAFACTLIGALYGPVEEIWDGLTMYGADPIDWHHILRSHAPPVMAAMIACWNTLKASKLVPDLLQDEPLLTEEIMTKVEKKG